MYNSIYKTYICSMSYIDKEYLIEYDFYKGYPQTQWEPEEPPEVVPKCTIDASGRKIGLEHYDMEFVREAEQVCWEDAWLRVEKQRDLDDEKRIEAFQEKLNRGW